MADIEIIRAGVVDGEKVRAANSAEARYSRDAKGRTWIRKRELEIGANGMLAEAVGYLLAHELGVPIPEAAVAFPEEENERSWLSRQIPNVGHWAAEHIGRISNIDVLGSMLALDALLINEDRHGGNILIEFTGQGGCRLWTIDMGNAYVGNPEDLLRRTTDIPSTHKVPRSLPFELARQTAEQTASRAASLEEPALAALAMAACTATLHDDAGTLALALQQRCRHAPQLVAHYLEALGCK